MRRLCLSLVLGLGSLGSFAGSASAGDWHHGHGPYCGLPVAYRYAYRPPVVVRSYYPAPYYYAPPPVVYRDYYPPPSGFAFSNRNFSIWFGQ